MLKKFTRPDSWQSGTLANPRGEQLRYGFLARHQHPVKNIIIGVGLSEFGQKYFETARFFDRHGYNIYIMDWFGQGGSGRHFPHDPAKRHSLGFTRDMEDLLLFQDKVVPGNAPAVILSHSMGAIPSLLAIYTHPGRFSGITMLAPFLGFAHPLLKGREPLLARFPVNAQTEKWLEEYIPGGGPWRPRDDPAKKSPPEHFSSDPVRSRLQDEWMRINPALQIGDVTRRFLRESAVAHMVLRQPGALESMRLPVQVFSASEEKIVSNTAIFNAVARFPDIRHQIIHGASHEILMERDDLRRPVLGKIHNFLKTCP